MEHSNHFDYFPSKLATGKAFCNRINELTQLRMNINKSRHTVIYSPRRYGKSSLVNKRQCINALLNKDFIYKVTMNDLELPYIKIGQYRVLDPLLSVTLRKLS